MAVDYSKSEEDRELIIRRRQKNTAASFERMRRRIDEQISEMNMSTVSERVRRQQLEEIRYSLQKQLGAYYSSLEDGLKSDMVSIGESVLNDSTAFYNALNMPISMSITSFPVEIMENVINGTVYGQKWFLSDALWGDYKSKIGQINDIVTQGIGMNLSSLDIAKQLEQYVDPKAMKPSQAIVTKCLRDPANGKLYSMDYVKRHPEKDWSNFTEKTSRYYYGKVDYNAQRLARTLVSHAYQQNVVRQAQANPFATGVKWEASGGERMCEICEERDGKIFPVDDVPMDHPNGMCTFTVETPSMMEMSDNLAKWVNGEPTDWDDQLNAYYEGRPIEHKSTANASGKEEIARRIAEGKDLTQEWQRRPDQFDFEIEDIINAQGFDGLPQVVSPEEFDRLVAEANGGDGFIAQRTYSAGDQQTLDAYRDMLYNGKWYVDCGTGGAQYGQGMYCAADYNGQLTSGIKEEMRHYAQLGMDRNQTIAQQAFEKSFSYEQFVKDAKLSYTREEFELLKNYRLTDIYDRKADPKGLFDASFDNGKYAEFNRIFGKASDTYIEQYLKQGGIHYTETFTLDKSAKIINFANVRTTYLKNGFEKLGINTSKIDYDSVMSGGKKWESFLRKINKENGTETMFKAQNLFMKTMGSDVGSLAVQMGYDAINAEGHGDSGSYTVILNRTKLIIKEPSR